MRRHFHQMRVTGLMLPLWLAAPFLASCQSNRPTQPTGSSIAAPSLQFAEVADSGETQGVAEYPRREGGATIRLHTPPKVFQLKAIRREPDTLGWPGIGFEIADSQKDAFRAWTTELVDHQLAILVGGKVIASPKVISPLPGRGVIEGGALAWKAEDVDSMVAQIQGATPR